MRLDTPLKPRGSAGASRGSGPTGALFRSPAYWRKKFGLYRAADTRRRRKRIGDPGIAHRKSRFALPDGQAWCPEAAHLLYAIRVRAAGGHRVLLSGVMRHV